MAKGLWAQFAPICARLVTPDLEDIQSNLGFMFLRVSFKVNVNLGKCNIRK